MGVEFEHSELSQAIRLPVNDNSVIKHTGQRTPSVSSWDGILALHLVKPLSQWVGIREGLWDLQACVHQNCESPGFIRVHPRGSESHAHLSCN